MRQESSKTGIAMVYNICENEDRTKTPGENPQGTAGHRISRREKWISQLS
jgi:hypothetical protein